MVAKTSEGTRIASLRKDHNHRGRERTDGNKIDEKSDAAFGCEEQVDADETRAAIEAEGRKDAARLLGHERRNPRIYEMASNIDSSYISGEIIPVLGGQTIAG